MKKLRRRVLIRESDYRKMIDNAYGGIIFDGMMLYNRSSFTPLTRKEIEKEVMWESLTGKEKKIWPGIHQNSARIFDGMRDYLYNIRYAAWKTTWDDDGYLCVQARSNTPISRVGWGIFEYDS